MDSNRPVKMPRSKHIVVDTEACGGCLTCELVCAARHFDGLCDRELSAIKIDADMIDYVFDYMACKQCSSASCVAVCPKNAFFFDENTGARCIDKDKCIRCGACVKVCPLSEAKYPPIRKVEKNDQKYIIKCDLCHGYEDGPYCIQVCPKAAVHLG